MIVFTAMGDSITSGVGATCPAKAYPQRIAGMLHSQHKNAFLQVEAYPGWTSLDLLHALRNLDPIQLRHSTVTSIWVGGDDLVLAGVSMLKGADKRMIADILSRYKRDLLLMIKTIRSVSRTSIVLCTQYNPFPKSSIATEAIAALNGVTAQAAKQCHVSLAPTHRWIDGRQPELIDGYRTGRIEDALGGTFPVHPNNLGHKVLAHGLLPYINEHSTVTINHRLRRSSPTPGSRRSPKGGRPDP
ncbi:SGNH/GDSL hydrolase family protein [Cohnella terricola]|uniref:SGNH/GDSL hydrolase family protein n=1 Tax=Cohnella terricola TaxID=1289167 RepID=A0A559JWD0_9BACL|nr:SGNH/GDSL hydrolase family protein [Cohnella terricola]TVY04186.1 SGNH/GDSL hydrolase family protein [Cohnella terricola]